MIQPANAKLSFSQLLLKEFDIMLTSALLRSLNLLGSGPLGMRVRAILLRGLGYKVGQGALLSTDIFIHSRRNDVRIGKGAFINKGVHFDALSPVHIGQFCDIGFNTVFTTSSHELISNYQTRRPSRPAGTITIEDHVWIGCNVIILGGVTIGHGSVIAAGSIITKNVPPDTLVRGDAARPVRSLQATAS